MSLWSSLCADVSLLLNQKSDSGEKPDPVNHPSHYTQGGIECIDAIEAATTNLKGIEAACTANAIKYLWRWKEKNGVQDLYKAIWYIEHLIAKTEAASWQSSKDTSVSNCSTQPQQSSQ